MAEGLYSRKFLIVLAPIMGSPYCRSAYVTCNFQELSRLNRSIGDVATSYDVPIRRPSTCPTVRPFVSIDCPDGWKSFFPHHVRYLIDLSICLCASICIYCIRFFRTESWECIRAVRNYSRHRWIQQVMFMKLSTQSRVADVGLQLDADIGGVCCTMWYG
jgi:hypothetical protein